MSAAMHLSGVNFDDSGTVIGNGGGNNRDNPRGIGTTASPVYALLPSEFPFPEVQGEDTAPKWIFQMRGIYFYPTGLHV